MEENTPGRNPEWDEFNRRGSQSNTLETRKEIRARYNYEKEQKQKNQSMIINNLNKRNRRSYLQGMVKREKYQMRRRMDNRPNSNSLFKRDPLKKVYYNNNPLKNMNNNNNSLKNVNKGKSYK